MARFVLTVLALAMLAGCASPRATVSAVDQAVGTDADATAQSGLLNLVSDLRAAFEAYMALVQRNQQAGRDIVTQNHGDIWLNRILALSWLVYPFVWRPIRNWRGRKEP